MVLFGTCLLYKRETALNGSGSNNNGGGICTQSQKSSFLRYLERETIKQTKESSFTFISVLFWLRSTWFCPFILAPNGRVPNGTVPLVEPEERIALPTVLV